MTQQARGSRLDLTMVGDWGTANFHTIWGWVSAHLRWRSALTLSQYLGPFGNREIRRLT